jgi:hypothetical protein
MTHLKDFACTTSISPGTNFSRVERSDFGLRGLLPPRVQSLELQARRVMQQLRDDRNNMLDQYKIVSQLAANNATLFYKASLHL